MKTKAEILYACERNTQNIFEAVMASFFKKVTPIEESLVDKTVLMVAENILEEGMQFDVFKERYNKSPLGTFIIELTEQLQDVNMFRFEAMEEHIAIEESENPYMMEKTLHDGLDEEFDQIVMTKNIKDEVAVIIADDIEAHEENTKKDAELVDDLDGIDDDEETDPEWVDDKPEDEDNSGTTDPEAYHDTAEDKPDDMSSVITEAAWVNMKSVDIESNELPDIDTLIKDKVFIKVDATEKGKLRNAGHAFVEGSKAVIKGAFSKEFLEQFKDFEDDKNKAKYFSWVMTKGCNQLLKGFLELIVGILISSYILGGVIVAVPILFIPLSIVYYGMVFAVAFLKGKQASYRNIVAATMGCSIIVELREKAKNASPEDQEKIENIINEFKIRTALTEMDITAYERMNDADLQRGMVKRKTETKTSFVKIAEDIAADFADSDINESVAGTAGTLAMTATTVSLVKELFLEK